MAEDAISLLPAPVAPGVVTVEVEKVIEQHHYIDKENKSIFNKLFKH